MLFLCCVYLMASSTVAMIVVVSDCRLCCPEVDVLRNIHANVKDTDLDFLNTARQSFKYTICHFYH